MFKATLVQLSCIGLMIALSGCSDDAPEITPSPSTNESVAVSTVPVETTAGASSMPPSSSAPASEPVATEKPAESEEPTESQEPAPAGEIPAALQGKWLLVGDEPMLGPCTEAESRSIAEIDATSIQLFRSLNTLVSVEKTGETIFVGTFTFGEGEEETTQIELVLLDGERLQYGNLRQGESNTELYVRCLD